MRNHEEEIRLKYALVRKYGKVDMFTGQECLHPTLHHINHDHTDNTFENGSLIAVDTQKIVHRYEITDSRYWAYANKLKNYKSTH
jgi:hypothetical protein